LASPPLRVLKKQLLYNIFQNHSTPSSSKHACITRGKKIITARTPSVLSERYQPAHVPQASRTRKAPLLSGHLQLHLGDGSGGVETLGASARACVGVAIEHMPGKNRVSRGGIVEKSERSETHSLRDKNTIKKRTIEDRMATIQAHLILELLHTLGAFVILQGKKRKYHEHRVISAHQSHVRESPQSTCRPASK
jgi:hypothetical protein